MSLFLPALRDTFELYRDDSSEAGQIRAQHLASVLRLTPAMAGANVVNLMLVGWALRAQAGFGLVLWGALMASGLLLAMRPRRAHPGGVRTTASRRALHRATLHAALLGAAWGAVPLVWLPTAAAPQQMLIATLITGLLSAGAFALSPLPAASLAWVVTLTLPSMVALLRTGEPVHGVLAALMLCFAAVCALAAMAASRRATALLRSQAEAARQRQMVALLLHDFEEHATEALWETRRDGTLAHVSPRLAALLGVADADLPGAPLLPLLQARSPQAARQLAEAMEGARPFRALRLGVAQPGDDGPQTRWWSLSAKPLFDMDGRPIGWRGVIADVTHEAMVQERLRHLAHHDPLTALANRLTLHEALGQAMRQGRAGVLFALDLDHFKSINDSLGHSAGDAVLTTVAARLQGQMRPGDLVARLGGDEFAVLAWMDGDEAEAQALGERLLQALCAPFEVAGRRLQVGCSIGMARLPGDAESVDALLGQADLALYHAKEHGRGRLAAYAAHLGDRSRRRVRIERALRAALEQPHPDALSLHWQPQVAVDGWTIVGAEALLRWDDPSLGRVDTAEFIEVAEQAGLIHALGGWVLQQACATAARRFPGLRISINVSALQLRDDGFPARVQQALADSGLPATLLELEITESVFLGDVDGALERLHALRRLGVRVALDDFGTGYSSLAYLRRFPFDTLKIDRAFVRELLLRGDARAIVSMIVQLAGTLGMRTVAEGVESTAQLDTLAACGCQEVQGWLASKPCAADAFERLRAQWQPQPQAQSAARAETAWSATR